MTSAKDLFAAVLRQWGCAIDPRHNPASAATFLRGVSGGGTLVVDARAGLYMEMECESIYEASVHVLAAIADLVTESLVAQRDLLQPIKPEMFVWVPHRQDVTETNDAARVINRIKETLK